MPACIEKVQFSWAFPGAISHERRDKRSVCEELRLSKTHLSSSVRNDRRASECWKCGQDLVCAVMKQFKQLVLRGVTRYAMGFASFIINAHGHLRQAVLGL
jgi:hypothetical protein